jgi:hypothetical protein
VILIKDLESAREKESQDKSNINLCATDPMYTQKEGKRKDLKEDLEYVELKNKHTLQERQGNDLASVRPISEVEYIPYKETLGSNEDKFEGVGVGETNQRRRRRRKRNRRKHKPREQRKQIKNSPNNEGDDKQRTSSTSSFS